MNHAELELRYPGQLIACFLNFGGIETGNLDQNPIAPDRTDYRFADSKHVNQLSNHLDCLVEHALGRYVVAALKSDEERCAAFDVETERDLLLGRPERGDA